MEDEEGPHSPEGPSTSKRAKLQLQASPAIKIEDWSLWSSNLGTLQGKLASGCLCHLETLELQRPFLLPLNEGSDPSEIRRMRNYCLQFVSTLNFLSDTALNQQYQGFICRKILDMASGVAMDEGIWEMLFEHLDSSDKFVTSASSKCLTSLLIWTKLPNLNEIVDELFNSVLLTEDNPMKLSHILETIRGVVEYKYKSGQVEDSEDYPEQDPPPNIANTDEDIQMVDLSSSSTNVVPQRRVCHKVEVDTEIIENEVKTLCVKALENWWTRLLVKFQNMMAHYDPVNESAIATFLSLWLSIISVNNSLDVVDTKHYYMHLKEFVPLLNPKSPAIVWRKLTDVFNEILCYGSALSLQGPLEEDIYEQCDLAHLIIRNVRSGAFLQGIPYSREFTGFGGNSIGPVDWEWKSEETKSAGNLNGGHRLGSANPNSTNPSSSRLLLLQQNQSLSQEKEKPNLPGSSSSQAQTETLGQITQSHVAQAPISSSSQSQDITPPSEPSPPKRPRRAIEITQTVFIGPSKDAIPIDDPFKEKMGDRPLLQKVILLVLKAVAVTVLETRVEDTDSSDSEISDYEEDETSSMHGSEHSISQVNDLAYVENSIREVYSRIDSYVKSLLPYHPCSPLGEWVVKLFIDQDDYLIEALLCILDTYRRIPEVPLDFPDIFHPVKTFITLLNAVSFDKDVLLDWLQGADTPHFLRYFLVFLKFIHSNWTEFTDKCGTDLDKTMSALIRLRLLVGRLVERCLWPYNITPVLRLMEKCEELFENDKESSPSPSATLPITTNPTNSDDASNNPQLQA